MSNRYGKFVLVTGASSGIGKAVAEAFAAEGCEVTGVSRHCEEGAVREVGSGRIVSRVCDVTKEDAVKALVASIPEIDIAVLCAGMGVAGPAEELPMAYARKQMEVNYFGVLTVGSYVLPRMRQQGRGLFLVISSIAGRVSIPMQCHYSSSKYAVEAYVEAVRMEMKRFGVRAALIEPGDTKTGFTAARQGYQIAPDSPYKGIYEKSIARMAHDEQNGKPPESVAAVALKLAGKQNPPVRVAVGGSYKALMFLLRLFPDKLTEWVLGKIYLPSE